MGLGSVLGGRFGTTGKAAFLVGKTQKNDGSWDFEDPAEVLINPSSIRIGSTTQVKKEEGVANETTADTAASDGKIVPKGITEERVEMTLIFNIVEAYNEKTRGVEFGALVSAAKSLLGAFLSDEDKRGDAAEQALTKLVNKTDFTNLSLYNRELCCYSSLLTASHKQLPVVFYWGNMVFSGLIVKFETTFNYFSSQGAPLGAEVALGMVAGVDDEAERFSPSTKALLGLVQEGYRRRLKEAKEVEAQRRGKKL